MKKRIVALCRQEADRLAKSFSRADRANNFAHESYHLARFLNCSETVADACYRKRPSGQLALAALKWVNAGQRDSQGIGDRSYVLSWFITYADLAGFEVARDLLQKAEVYNTTSKMG